MSKKDLSDALVAERRAQLLKMLSPGDTVYTVLKHVSSSGMMRVIDLVIPYTRVDEYADNATESKLLKKKGVQAYAVTAPDSDRTFQRGELVTPIYNGGALESCVILYSDGESATYPAADVRVIRTAERLAVRSISGLVADLLDYKWDDRGGLKIGGCGMDMGFHAVYGLGRRLWPDGTPKAHGSRNGSPDRDGGYALKHTWL